MNPRNYLPNILHFSIYHIGYFFGISCRLERIGFSNYIPSYFSNLLPVLLRIPKISLIFPGFITVLNFP